MLLPDPKCLQLDRCLMEKHSITLVATTSQPSAPCPGCHQPSQRVHSRYRRTLADLPWQGVTVRLRLLSRKFVCSTRDCSQQIFTERLPSVATPYARRTTRLQATLRHLGLALGGEGGARLAVQLGLAISPDRLLHYLRQAPPPAVTPRVLGVDDWAWRKRQRYGTILVDLERHRPVDLLPDRQADSLAGWLKAHPGVEVISRDRAGAYAEAAHRAAPQALQVADRWHLLKNLRESLQQWFSSKHRLLSQAAQALAVPEVPLARPSLRQESGGVPARLTRAQQREQERRGRRLARYQAVRELYRQGASQRAISERLGIDRRTVRRWMRAGGFPERAAARDRPSLLKPHLPYLQQCWAEGCHNAAQLWRQLRERGFTGSAGIVRRYVAGLRAQLPLSLRRARGPRPADPAPRFRVPSPQRMAWLLMRPEAEWKAEEQAFLDQLNRLCPEVGTAQRLASQFSELVRQRQANQLDEWLQDAKNSGLPELRRFALSLQGDRNAVGAALQSEWSNGQVEGQIHRLKLVKRQMYGRAQFDLLRGRFLQAA
jgi:transposase